MLVPPFSVKGSLNERLGRTAARGTGTRSNVKLRLLASVRMAYRERGGTLPSITQMDDLLDELLGARPAGKATTGRHGHPALCRAGAAHSEIDQHHVWSRLIIAPITQADSGS